MHADIAIKHIKILTQEARDAGLALRDEGRLTAWRSRVQTILSRALGENHRLTQDLAKLWFTPSVYRPGMPQSDYIDAFQRGMTDALAYLDSAIFELELVSTSDDTVDAGAFSPELWQHVQAHIEASEWQKVASQTAIYVEDCVRQWCGNPRSKDNRSLVGKGLYSHVFGDQSQFKLGSEPSETEGWRALATGFAQAAGNVDRHNLQKRDDAKLYAIGVLGLGSLLLTQLQHQHGDKLQR